MAEQIEICVIDDDPSHRKLVSRLLEKWGYRVDQASDGQEGLSLIRRTRPKVILSDWMMPHLDGLALCEAVRADPAVSDTYFILLTSRDSVDDKASALETGADDFLAKPCDAREMIARVRVGIRMWTLKQELREAAITDGLTGLYNHHYFSRLLHAEFERACRYHNPLSLIIADLDHFKSVNDTCGHEAGNMVLHYVSQTLKNSVRTTDIVARYGGEEFAVILPETSLQNAMDLAERLRSTIVQTLPPGMLGDRIITASFGVAGIEDPQATSVQQFVNLADQALYLAKRTGRNRVATCSQASPEIEQETTMRQDRGKLQRQVARLTAQTEDLKRQIVCALLEALEIKAPSVAAHARNVGVYADAVAARLHEPPQAISLLGRAALLHEIGTIGISSPPSGYIAHDDSAEIHDKSRRILGHIQPFAEELRVIRHMTESFDGSGQPDGLRAEDIPLLSRILRAADAFDRLTTGFPDGAAANLDDAMLALQRRSEIYYDPRVLRALSACLNAEREAWQLRIGRTTSEPQAVH